MVAMCGVFSRRVRLLESYRQQNAEQLEGRKASVALQIQGLEREIKDWDARIVEISRKAAQYQRLKSNAQRVQALYQQLLATVQTLDSNKDVGAESVSIMEPASPPITDGDRTRNNIILAFLACVAGSFGLLLFLDRLDDRVNSFSDLEEGFEEPVLAQIPLEKLDKQRPEMISPTDDRQAFVEAYRNLRSSVLCVPEG